VLVAAFGALMTARWAVRGTWSPRAAVTKTLRVALPAGLAAVAVAASVSRTVSSIDFNRRFMENQRTVAQAAGQWIAASTPAGAKLFAEPIGFLGFYSRRYVWDTVGMVSPVLTDYRRRFPQANRWFWESLHDLQPELVVLRDFERPANRMFAHGPPLLPPEGLTWFDANYRVERTFRPTVPGPDANALVLYRRSGVAVIGTASEKASKN
jgi:hypothetical protein